MKAKNVKIGKVYECTVGKNTTKVRIMGTRKTGAGWDATNIKTNKDMVITSPERLVKEIGFIDNQEKTSKGSPRPAPVKVQKAVDAVFGITADTGATGAKVSEKASQKPKTRKEAPQRQLRANGGKLSGLDAAVEVLKAAGAPMNAKDIVETAVAKGLWATGGKTPGNTLHAAISREIAKKADARFTKAERGKFMLV